MQTTMLQQGAATRVASMPRVHQHPRWSRLAVQSQSGRSEPFNEGAVQVQRLVNRDRAQLLGNKVDILDKFETEFGDPADEPSTSALPSAAAATAAVAAAEAAATATTSSSSDATSSSSSTASPPAAAAAAAPASPFAAAPSAAASPFAAAAGAAAKPPAAVKTNFGASGAAGGAGASPFGTSSRTRSTNEPAGLSPDMGPDPIVKMAPTPGNLLSKITLTQVVLFCTFSSMIGLMLATFSVVVKSGAVRLAGIE